MRTVVLLFIILNIQKSAAPGSPHRLWHYCCSMILGCLGYLGFGSDEHMKTIGKCWFYDISMGFYPLVNLDKYRKSPCFMFYGKINYRKTIIFHGKINSNMAIFYSYVGLPEGMICLLLLATATTILNCHDYRCTYTQIDSWHNNCCYFS